MHITARWHLQTLDTLHENPATQSVALDYR
jgi:hypothetical protein